MCDLRDCTPHAKMLMAWGVQLSCSQDMSGMKQWDHNSNAIKNSHSLSLIEISVPLHRTTKLLCFFFVIFYEHSVLGSADSLCCYVVGYWHIQTLFNIYNLKTYSMCKRQLCSHQASRLTTAELAEASIRMRTFIHTVNNHYQWVRWATCIVIVTKTTQCT